MKKNIVIRASILLLVILALFFLIIISTNILVNKYEVIEDADYFEAQKLKPVAYPNDTLRVMDWNIKFGGARIDFFFDCFGTREVMTKEEVESNLSALAVKINQYKPDIIFLQEVDIESDRSGGVNMVQWLLDNTDMNYAVYASQWNVTYLPQHSIGRINSGNLILSKWKLENATRIPLPLLEEQDPITQFFYLRRNLLVAEINPPNQKKVILINTHLEAYAYDNTRKNQIDRLAVEANSGVLGREKIIIFGGDLNTLPPKTKNLSNFDDNACKEGMFVMDDYKRETEWLTPLYKNFNEIIPLDKYTQNEEKYYTHTVNGKSFWNRRLDYLFSNRQWTNGMVHQNAKSGGMETMPLSDHAPITGTLWLIPGQVETYLESVKDSRKQDSVLIGKK